MRPAYKKWLWMGGCGSAIFCAGLCGVVESGFLKHSGAPILQWASTGTVSLVVLMVGLVLLLKASKLEDEAKRT